MDFKIKIIHPSGETMVIPVDENGLVLPATPFAVYHLVNQIGDIVTEHYTLEREDDDLEIIVEGDLIATIKDFFGSEVKAAFFIDGDPVASSDLMVADETVVADEAEPVASSSTMTLADSAESLWPGSKLTLGSLIGGSVVAAGIAASSDSSSGSSPAPQSYSLTIDDDTDGIATSLSGDVTYTFTFSQAVNGFTAEDIVVSGGTSGTFSQISDNVYTLTVTPDEDYEGEMTVSVAEGVVIDDTESLSEAATDSSQLVDTLAPETTVESVTITTETMVATLSASLADDECLMASVDSGETWADITGFVSGLEVDWTDVAFVDDSGTIPLNVVDESDTIQLKVVDAAGNEGEVSIHQYLPDTTAPALTISDDTDGSFINLGDAVTYTFTFSEDVSGFTVDDITVSDGTADTFTQESDSIYTLSVIRDTGDNYIQISVATGAAVDAGGNSTPSSVYTSAVAEQVVFDLTTGTCSTGQDEYSFDAEQSYAIYIVVEETSAEVSYSDTLWSGVSNLGSDDAVLLCGAGTSTSEIIGVSGGNVLAAYPGCTKLPVTTREGYSHIKEVSEFLWWTSGYDYIAGKLIHNGAFLRGYNGSGDLTGILTNGFDSSVAIGWANSINATVNWS